jgi:hypothetical protein
MMTMKSLVSSCATIVGSALRHVVWLRVRCDIGGAAGDVGGGSFVDHARNRLAGSRREEVEVPHQPGI